MYVGFARYDFLVPASGSLKDKRSVVRALKERIRTRVHAAVAEVDHQDLRQRGAIGVSCVSESSFHARKMLQEIERSIRSQYAIEVLSVETEVMKPYNG